MSRRDTALEFLKRVCAVDIDGLILLLAEELKFTCPIHEFNSRRDAYSQISWWGTHTLNWDGLNNWVEHLASGLYLYQLRASDDLETRKLLLLR